jgi:multidrug efflux pump subunit AcrB
MLASYFLSRTVVPTMVKFLLKAHGHDEAHEKSSFFGRLHDRFNGGFETLRIRYARMLSWSLGHRRFVCLVMAAAVEQLGLSQRDVGGTVLTSLSSSGQASPNFWLNFQNGVNYQVAVQTPQYKMDSLSSLLNTSIVTPGQTQSHLFGNLATLERSESPVIVNHYNVQPVFDILANVQGRDLGGVADDVQGVLSEFQSKLPRGSFLSMRGQVQSMNSSFVGLGAGIVFAIVLVYLLMVVNFQSWTDPFIIITALPGALCGIAAVSAGYTRLRPVIMTALAMIIGMLPMSLGFGEGGEQNAPLGRAVIGGLLMATFATL